MRNTIVYSPGMELRLTFGFFFGCGFGYWLGRRQRLKVSVQEPEGQESFTPPKIQSHGLEEFLHSDDIPAVVAALREHIARNLEIRLKPISSDFLYKFDDPYRRELYDFCTHETDKMPYNDPANPNRLPSDYTDKFWEGWFTSSTTKTILSEDRSIFFTLMRGISPDDIVDKSSPRLRQDPEFWKQLVEIRNPLVLKAPTAMVEADTWMQKIFADQKPQSKHQR